MDQYIVIPKEITTNLCEFVGIFSFSFVVSLLHEMNTNETQNYGPTTFVVKSHV